MNGPEHPEPTKRNNGPSVMLDLDIFEYHAPTNEQIGSMAEIRAAIKNAATVIAENCPPCADTSAAIRDLRKAMMQANAAIVLEGRV